VAEERKMKEPFTYNVMLWINTLSVFMIAAGLLVLLLAIIPKVRKFSGRVLTIIGVVFFLFLLVYSSLAVYYIGGTFWLIFGLLSAIVSIIPLAFICTIVSREWVGLGDLALFLAFALVPYFLGAWILEKEENRER
jgi:hypothetical protein